MGVLVFFFIPLYAELQSITDLESVFDCLSRQAQDVFDSIYTIFCGRIDENILILGENEVFFSRVFKHNN